MLIVRGLQPGARNESAWAAAYHNAMSSIFGSMRRTLLGGEMRGLLAESARRAAASQGVTIGAAEDS